MEQDGAFHEARAATARLWSPHAPLRRFLWRALSDNAIHDVDESVELVRYLGEVPFGALHQVLVFGSALRLSALHIRLPSLDLRHDDQRILQAVDFRFEVHLEKSCVLSDDILTFILIRV